MDETPGATEMLGSIDSHGLTVRGERHARNHDRFAIAALSRSMRVRQSNLSLDDDSRVHGRTQGHLFLVADGISSGERPERASSAAIDSVVHWFVDEMPWFETPQLRRGEGPRDVAAALEAALRHSQHELRRAAVDSRTTLTLAFVAWPDLYVAHVGDSRCYVRRQDGTVEQVTSDHTVAAVREANGVSASERDLHLLWNALGGEDADLHPEIRHARLELGDTLLLCTDGVSRSIADEELRSVLALEEDAHTICRRIVEPSNGDDRTAVVARFLPHEAGMAGLDPDTAPPPVEDHVDEPSGPVQALARLAEGRISAARTSTATTSRGRTRTMDDLRSGGGDPKDPKEPKPEHPRPDQPPRPQPNPTGPPPEPKGPPPAQPEIVPPHAPPPPGPPNPQA